MGKASGRQKRQRAAVLDDAPRYREIAAQLGADIASGRYPVGSFLPTEIALCKRHRISRFTAREALRLLREAGLVTRRQGSGTQVITSSGCNRFKQSFASIGDLLQYAQTTELRLVHVRRIVADQFLAATLRCKRGEPWILAAGVRYEGSSGAAVCVTRVYLNPALDGIETHLRARKGAIYDVIEHAYNITFTRVEQVIAAVSLNRDDATNLSVRQGQPALRLTRYYYDAAERLLEVADSLHPGERFAYSLSLQRDSSVLSDRVRPTVRRRRSERRSSAGRAA
jgi:GntR family transcriptional regulator